MLALIQPSFDKLKMRGYGGSIRGRSLQPDSCDGDQYAQYQGEDAP